MPVDTSRFHSIYDAVTADLRNYLWEEHTASPSRLSTQEMAWFEFLIYHFQREYKSWPQSAEPRVITYLDTAEKCGADLKLAAHVFLHVAYDLPRMICLSFEQYGGMDPGWRGVFVRPGPRFLRVFQQQMRDGTFGMLGRLVGQLDAAQALGYWLIALRSVAWIHAETLHDIQRSRGYQLLHVHRRMIDAMNTSLNEARKKPWVLGIERLNNPHLTAGVPLFGAAFTWEQVVGGAIGAGVVAAGALGFRRHRVTSSIDVLGALTYRGMVRALDPGRFEIDGPAPQLA